MSLERRVKIMDTLYVPTATLPRGKVVQLFRFPERWTIGEEYHGYVDPSELAGDLDQPRQHMNEVELNSLTKSVAVVGVKESLTITPRSMAPWARVSPSEENRLFVIVGGHRRNASALRAGIEAVPVTIRIYRTQDEYLEDAILLNDNRANLRQLEEGRAIVRLLTLSGNTEERVAKMKGMSVNTLRNRVALTKLPSDLQALLNPALPKRKRLGSTIGSELGKLGVPSDTFLREHLGDLAVLEDMSDTEKTHAFQRWLLSDIKSAGLGSVEAIDHIQKMARVSRPQSGLGSRSERKKRSHQLEIVENYLKGVLNSRIHDWSQDEWGHVFAGDPVLLEELLSKFQTCSVKICTIGERLFDLLEAFESREVAVESAQAPARTLPARPKLVPPMAEPKASAERSPLAIAPKAPQPVRVFPQALLGRNERIQFPLQLEYWHFDPPGEYKIGPIRTPQHFVRLWQQKLFRWQKEGGKEKPHDHPDIKDIMEMMNRR